MKKPVNLNVLLIVLYVSVVFGMGTANGTPHKAPGYSDGTIQTNRQGNMENQPTVFRKEKIKDLRVSKALEYEARFFILKDGIGLSGAEIMVYSDTNDFPEFDGQTNAQGLVCNWSNDCTFHLEEGTYTMFIVSMNESTAIVKTVHVGADGDLIVDITNDWDNRVRLTINAQQLDTAEPLSGWVYISISKAWPRWVGSVYGSGVIHVTPQTYYYIGIRSSYDGYFLYKSDVTVTSDSVVDFKPTSSSVSTFHATHDFDSCQLLPWLKSPDIRSASSYTTPSLILTPGTYTIEANLIKNDWEFDFHLMDYQTFLPGDSIQATAGGDFSIETFETDLPSYLPGESIIFTLSINDHYGHRLFYSRNDSGQGNFPYLVIKNPDNEIVHEASTYFYQKTVQLDSNAVAGTYSAALSFETGPHQGELFETTFFDVEAKDPCLADFNGDGDVDGQDLANLIDNPWFMGVADFSAGFGMEDCTNN